MNADGQVRWLHATALNEFDLSLENIAIDSVQQSCVTTNQVFIFRRHTKQGLVNNKTGVI